ncbi:MAG: histidine kinase [Cytophagales bacterium]|nr:histidine kinase [Cytophagales bacterium]
MNPKRVWQLGGVLLLGVGICLLLDLVLSLKYRYYTIHWHWQKFAAGLLLASLVTAGVWASNRWLNRRLPWEQSVRGRFLVQFVVQSAMVLAVIVGLRNGLLRPVFHPQSAFVRLGDELLIGTVAAVAMLLVTATDLAVFLLNKWRVSLAQLERFKKENIEFHLEMLKTQVNPHFLFNSLNTLSSLIYTDQDTAAEFVRQLATVYRYVLENRTKETVLLREELTFLQAYAYLMDLRFGHNLRISIELPDAAQRLQIAPLTLQMLIENAVKHNIVSHKKPLDLRIFQENNFLVVQNTLQPKAVKEFSSQIGLDNIRSRYRFLTESEVEVQNDGRTFTVRIPLLEDTALSSAKAEETLLPIGAK